MADSDFDLRSLPEIARDRSAAGRAKLFAFLAALLASRWGRLSGGERHELAALIAILWPRGAEADRAKLAMDLAGKADLPDSLRCFLPDAATTAWPVQVAAVAPPVDPSAAHSLPADSLPVASLPDDPFSADPFPAGSRADMQAPSGGLPATGAPRKKGISILITQQPVLRVARSSGPPNIGVAPASAPIPAAGPSISVDRPVIRVPLRPAAVSADAPAEISGKPSSKDAPAPIAAPSASAATAGIDAGPAHAAAVQSAAISAAADEQPASGNPPTEPRATQHHLTVELLGEVLASGDLARFEVMLASMTGLRAALLRRVLRDSGGEAFAILARAAGVEAEAFSGQWQHWQRRQGDLGRATSLRDQASAKRIAAFFAALTDQQIDRLIRRWRSDENRFFAAPAIS